MTILQCANLSKNFMSNHKKQEILKDITYTFQQGLSYALMGASGSGKSTLIHLLASLDDPSSGSVLLDNKNFSSYSQKEKNSLMSIVFQSPYLIKELSVLENIILAGQLAGRNKKECIEETKKLLDDVGLKHKEHESVGSLSGGQKQRVCLVRALLNKPKFILADELTGNLDSKTGETVLNLLLTFQKKWNIGLIVSTHNQKVADSLQVELILKDGTLFQSREKKLLSNMKKGM